MKVFLSALENNWHNASHYGNLVQKCLAKFGRDKPFRYNLLSYYYIEHTKAEEIADLIRDNSEEILVDSGAHSFQKGIKVDFGAFTKRYADFIRRFDRPNVLGYFEMDVDNVLGYEAVLELRKILTGISDKIIPVWHPNRGLSDFYSMCKEYAGRIVAITGFKGMEIQDEQYVNFVKTAKRFGCKVHCLGMTRRKILDAVPFDFVDSSSWAQHAIRGRIGTAGKVTKEFSRTHRVDVFSAAYIEGMKMQEHYYNKWRKVCQD